VKLEWGARGPNNLLPPRPSRAGPMLRRGTKKDKTKPFDGTLNSKSTELVKSLLTLLNKQVGLEGIYRIPGDMGEVRRTKEAMNQGKKVSFENMAPHTQASLLKAFFKDLEDPIFVASLYPVWIAAAQHKDRKLLMTRILNLLPQHNFELISALMVHLQWIAKHSEKNLMTADNLAIVFGPILLRPQSVSAQTLLADVPWVNRCIGLMITESSFFFKNKLLLLHRKTEKTALFDEMKKAGAALIIEERKKREKEEKRKRDEQRKSERKKRFNTFSSKTPLKTPEAESDNDKGKSSPRESRSPAVSSNNSASNSPSCSPSPLARHTVISGRTDAPPLPPLPPNLVLPPSCSPPLRRTVSAYVPASPLAASATRKCIDDGESTASPVKERRPAGIILSSPISTYEYGNGFPHPATNVEPLSTTAEMTEEEKKKKEEDEKLLQNMKRRYSDRRKQTLDRWFKKKHDWTTVEEFEQAMQERAKRIEKGDYSQDDLRRWFEEMGDTSENLDDEECLLQNSSEEDNVSLPPSSLSDDAQLPVPDDAASVSVS